MSKMFVDAVRRSGSADRPFRQLEVVQGKSRLVLDTAIKKISWAPEFRHGASARPIEQYIFQVGDKVVERFADATALVLKRHNVEFEANVPRDELQTYVRKALEIMEGKEPLHVHNAPLPADAKEAVVTFTEEALV